MSIYEIGIRKHVEFRQLQYWLIINAKSAATNEGAVSVKEKSSKKGSFSLNFINSSYWKNFIFFTIILNVFVSISSISSWDSQYFWELSFLVLLTCFFFWIDFLAAVTLKIQARKTGGNTRSTTCLVVEAISLLPISFFYLISVSEPDKSVFWWLRTVTLLRFYRVPYYFSKVSTSGKNHWQLSMIAYIFFFIFFVFIFANINLTGTHKHLLSPISDWNESMTNEYVVALYFSLVTMLNVGYGDIVPNNRVEMIICSLAMIIGFSVITGVLTGALATEIANMEKRREIYRHEFEALVKNLKERKIDKRVLSKISENLRTLWKYKKGLASNPQLQLLPLSLRKEIFFDINFGLLNRSLIFSLQPRSFLRSVALLMVNMSFLPGDIIMEPFGMVDAMFCIASGVIEILSDENDETTLFSLTSGSILGEATLFMSIPIRCIIRASTYVELQVLTKVKFSRLTLKYPSIIRSMRLEVFARLSLAEKEPGDLALEALIDSDVQELSRRKGTKRFLQDVRNHKKKKIADITETSPLKTSILGLYVLSENIPRVKALPIYLVKSRPWILTPNTTLTEVWNFFIIIIVSTVAFYYPFLAGFIRKINNGTETLMWLVDIAYIVDLYIQCTTAVERKDHFTYSVSIKEIIAHKLKTVGFYLDVLAAVDIATYAEVLWSIQYDYAYVLLSQNRILKAWQIPPYFAKLEERMNFNVLLVRTVKFIFYFCLTIDWTAVILYLEACPGETCIEERWYSFLEEKAVKQADPNPTTEWPGIVSLYWACISVSGVGYGDITAKSVADCTAVIFCVIAGAAVLTLCLAQASSTFKYLERTRTEYQEEVFAVDRFMREHEISKDVHLKVRNYFQLQWNYDKGFLLSNKLLTEKLSTQQKRIVLTGIMKAFLTVPFFREAGTDFLWHLATSSRVQLLPPQELITVAGSFNRAMYIIEKGYCEVSTKEAQQTSEEKKIISPVNAFGFLEMVLGIPFELNVQTLTHVRIICLDYVSYLRAVTKLPQVKADIDEKIQQDYVRKKMRGYNTLSFKPLEATENDEATLKAQRRILSKSIINVYNYQKSLAVNYWEPFRAWGKFRFFQFLLMPFVIAPYSIFIKVWMALRILGVTFLSLIVPIHFSVPFPTDVLGSIIMVLEAFAFIDMWLMFHVAYYDERGILMVHPAKTAIWYLKGNFILDLLTLFPYYVIIRASFPSDREGPSLFHDAPGLIMVLQFYKFFQGCYYLENNILRRTEYIKILKFVPLAVIVTNLTSGLLIQHECYRRNSQEIVLKVEKPLGTEYQQSLQYFCKPHNTTVNFRVILCCNQLGPVNMFPIKKETRSCKAYFFIRNLKKDLRCTYSLLILTVNCKEYAEMTKMYITTFYWVTSTVTGCGFGDISADDKFTMVVIMIIVVIGIFLYGYMFANLTSSMISMHNSVMKYRRRMREMVKFMKKKNIDRDLQKRLAFHYEYNWLRTEGASPQKMFTYVHEALRESIVTSMYEWTIRQIPSFVAMEASVIRVIGKYLDEIYFLRGETIVKFSDIQEYIYLIYRGQVNVISENGEVITTMGSGGMFGNISKTPFSLSSVTVIAAKNVDLLRLDSGNFFKALQVFPNIKPLINLLTSTTTDYIEPLKESNENGINLKLSQIDTIPYEITIIREVSPILRFSILENSPDINFFYLKNSIFKIPRKGCFTWVILPYSQLHKAIGLSIFVFSYVSAALTIYMFAFQDFSIHIILLSYFLDVMFLFKIALEFQFSFLNKHGEYVVNKIKIQKRYLQSKTFCFDVAANLPLEIFAAVVPTSWMLQVLTILRLNRVLRLYCIFEFFELKFKILMINKIYLELSWILVWITLMTHFFACIWYFVACPLGYCQEKAWVTNMSLEKGEKWRVYIISIYFIFTLITTTGYGDIPILSTEAMITATAFMIISRFSLVLLAGAMAAVISVHSANWYTFQERIGEMIGSVQRQNLSEYETGKMWNYVTSLWLEENGKQMPKFLKKAPYSMKCEVMHAMFGHHLDHCYAFSHMKEAFLRQLATCLHRFIYFAGNYIVQQGDTDHTMYFIHKGQVSVLTIHPDLMETIHFTLMDDDNFGMIQGLTIGKPHNFSYRAETDVEIISLTLNHWQHLLKYFPEAAQLIHTRIESLSEEETSFPTA